MKLLKLRFGNGFYLLLWSKHLSKSVVGTLEHISDNFDFFSQQLKLHLYDV